MAPAERREALRDFRFGMTAAIVLQTVLMARGSGSLDQKWPRNGRPAAAGQPFKNYGAWPPEGGRYFSSASLRPTFRLSKFISVLSTRE